MTDPSMIVAPLHRGADLVGDLYAAVYDASVPLRTRIERCDALMQECAHWNSAAFLALQEWADDSTPPPDGPHRQHPDHTCPGGYLLPQESPA
jgi:hypothetical protein